MAQPEVASTRWALAEAIGSFLGAGIAGALWWAHRQGEELPCTGDGRGCDLVYQSPWGHLDLAGHLIPVALIGLLGYLALLTLSMMKLGADTPAQIRRLHRLFRLGSGAGFVYSWYLQYVAHFRLDAFCVWCFSSACLMTLLFGLATWEGRARGPAPPGPEAEMEARQTTHV